MKFILLFALLFTVSCGANQKCGNYIENSILLTFDLNFPKENKEAMKTAANKWNDLIGKQVLVINTKNDPNPYSPLIFFNQNFPGQSKLEAFTTRYYLGQIIYKVEMDINGKDYNIADSDLYSNVVDNESLFLHELGHVLGLDHSQDPNSVMYSTLNWDTKRIEFQPWEIAEINCRYK